MSGISAIGYARSAVIIKWKSKSSVKVGGFTLAHFQMKGRLMSRDQCDFFGFILFGCYSKEKQTRRLGTLPNEVCS